MRRLLALPFILISASGNFAIGQQLVVPVPAPAVLAAPAAAPIPAAIVPAAVALWPSRLVPGSKLFIEPMDGFDTYLSAAIIKKKVPVMIVDDRAKADFVVVGSSHVDKAGWAKTIFVSPNPHAEASISVKNAHTGDLVFAYNVDKAAAVRANQSTAEACAKHLKEAIEKK